MRTLKASILSLSLVAALSSTAAAQQVGFDDVTSAPFAWITNGYAGLNWDNAFAISPLTFFPSVGAAGGFNTALTSGSHVMGNGGGGALTISGSTFNLMGGTFASAWRKGMTVTAVGSSNGLELYNQSFLVDWDNAQYIGLNMFGVDNVIFTSAGGTFDVFSDRNNASFAIDDLTFSKREGLQEIPPGSADTVVPEPMTMSLVGFGLMAVGVAARRRRQAR